MPTNFFTFLPQPTSPPFQFQPTLDENDYHAQVTWNVFGQRWYIGLTTSGGIPVFLQAMIGSPQLITVESIRWDNGFAFIRTASLPTSFRVGDSFNMAVSGFLPIDYNTPRVLALVTEPNEIMYPMAAPPQPATALGRATYDLNLAGGYFVRSSLLFRMATRQIEVYTP
jgi:hypothetical protein